MTDFHTMHIQLCDVYVTATLQLTSYNRNFKEPTGASCIFKFMTLTLVVVANNFSGEHGQDP